MACPASEINQKPLQNAMRLVKVAIQLDSGNRHKVTEKRSSAAGMRDAFNEHLVHWSQ